MEASQKGGSASTGVLQALWMAGRFSSAMFPEFILVSPQDFLFLRRTCTWSPTRLSKLHVAGAKKKKGPSIVVPRLKIDMQMTNKTDVANFHSPMSRGKQDIGTRSGAARLRENTQRFKFNSRQLLVSRPHFFFPPLPSPPPTRPAHPSPSSDGNVATAAR